MDVKMMKAHCPHANKFFLFSIKGNKASDFMPITKEQYDKVSTTIEVKETADNLLPCQYERTRTIAGSEKTKRALYPQCKSDKKYNFQCAYCPMLQIEKVGGKGKALEDCEILVTQPLFDNIGTLLTSMRLKHKEYLNNLAQCDILFINCGTTDRFDYNKLRKFVENGGILYVSDLAISHLISAFPDFITSHTYEDSTTITCEIVDPELSQFARTINIFFDLSGWAKITRHSGEVLLRKKGIDSFPVMVMKKYGKGVVFYTSFHNYHLASKQEQELLKLFICKQLAAKTGKSVVDISALLGLNFKL